MHMRPSVRTTAALAAVITTALATAVTVAAPAASAAAAAAPGCASPSWKLVRTPAGPGSVSVLEFPYVGESDAAYEPSGWLASASMLGDGSAMLVGGSSPLAWDSPQQPWVLRLAGGSVTQATLPTQGVVGFYGTAGSFDSRADGWLLGQADAPSSVGGAFGLDNAQTPQVTERWNGTAWTMTPVAVSARPATEQLSLSGIAAVSPADAWAVGRAVQVKAGNTTGALVEHWDGTSWNIVPNPASAERAALTVISVVSPGDVWAAGYQAGTGKNDVPLVEHFDGTQWSVLPTPPLAAGDADAELNAVSVAGDGEVWVAGSQQRNQASQAATAIPLAERWNGSAWALAQLPALPSGETIDAIYAASASDVWASTDAGNSATGTGVFLHWTGGTWAPVAMPGPKEYGLNYYYPAIFGAGPSSVWAAGYSSIAPQLARLSCGGATTRKPGDSR